MQKLITLILLAALGTGAYLSKPGKKEFTEYLAQKAASSDTNSLKGSWDEMVARRYADKCTYLDRVFWMTVKHNDETIYVGAFSHWFNRAELKHDINKAQQTTTDEINQLGKTTDQIGKIKD